ncbi:hypothetical protein BJ742DRAFT_844096, partial [Cladochytrium replicatum]
MNRRIFHSLSSATRIHESSRCFSVSTATSTCPDLKKAVHDCLSVLNPSRGEPLIVAVSPVYGPQTSSLPTLLPPSNTAVGTVVTNLVDAASSTMIPGVSISTLKGIESSHVFAQSGLRPTWSKAVGRWPDLGRGFGSGSERGGFDLDHFRSVSSSAEAGQGVLTGELAKLAEQSRIPDLFLLFSDREPQQFLDALSKFFPTSKIIGAVGAQTPFVNGLPFTLLHNGKIQSNGVVGLAMFDKSGLQSSRVKTAFPGVRVLGDSLTITNCKGNVVLNLDGANAVAQILKRINKHGRSGVSDDTSPLTLRVDPYDIADKQIYARIWDAEETLPATEDPAQMSTASVYKLIGGDPSKGILAIESSRDLLPGMKIQFLYPSASFHTEQSTGQTLVQPFSKDFKFAFSTTHPDSVHVPLKDNDEGRSAGSDVLAVTTEAIICKRGGLDQWETCDIPYSVSVFS